MRSEEKSTVKHVQNLSQLLKPKAFKRCACPRSLLRSSVALPNNKGSLKPIYTVRGSHFYAPTAYAHRTIVGLTRNFVNNSFETNSATVASELLSIVEASHWPIHSRMPTPFGYRQLAASSVLVSTLTRSLQRKSKTYTMASMFSNVLSISCS